MEFFCVFWKTPIAARVKCPITLMADEMRSDQRHAETEYSHGGRHRHGMAQLTGISGDLFAVITAVPQ
jgi:hypothetical protein